MSFAQDLSGLKADNSGTGGKVKVRELVLDGVGSASVMDAFAGSGEMYRKVWHRAERYVGCDQRWFPDSRLAYVVDNRRLLRCLDLQEFNIFDLDSYGAPWEQAIIIARRRRISAGERVGMVLTEGSGLNLKFGRMPKTLAAISGLRRTVSGGAKLQDEIVERAVANMARLMAARVVRCHQAKPKRKTGSAMRYIGLVLEGLSGAEAPAGGCGNPPGDSAADPS